MRLTIISLALALSGTSITHAKTADDIQNCVSANFPSKSSSQVIELKAIDRGGNPRELKADLHWRRGSNGRSRLNLKIKAPADLGGSAYLLIENSGTDAMYSYLPALRKVKRISGRASGGQLWGTDFSYDDLRQMQGAVLDGQRERLEDSEIEGRAVYVTALLPDKSEESAYKKVVSYVDQQSCVVLRMEMFERNNKPRKRLSVTTADLEQINDKWIARAVKLEDLRDKTHTSLKVLDVRFDEKQRSSLFNSNSFYR